MKYFRKVAVAVDLTQDFPQVFQSIKELENLKHAEIHFVNVFQTTYFPMGLGETSLVYPLETDRKLIEESVMATLEKKSSELLPKDFTGKVILKCLFSDDPKFEFSKYVATEKIDLVVVATRQKHGIFQSSFTNYLANHSAANILMLKHKI